MNKWIKNISPDERKQGVAHCLRKHEMGRKPVFLGTKLLPKSPPTTSGHWIIVLIVRFKILFRKTEGKKNWLWNFLETKMPALMRCSPHVILPDNVWHTHSVSLHMHAEHLPTTLCSCSRHQSLKPGFPTRQLLVNSNSPSFLSSPPFSPSWHIPISFQRTESLWHFSGEKGLYLVTLGLQDRGWTISLSGRKVRPQISQGTNWLWELVQAASFKASRS